ncbi:Paternally-expressed gene 3 protein [Galemys pyrenaicus]|uniref:Paternally-expressed gene 3 protein n=1 Tax=Galemys pyrenaicus TaxID=202257 RepID=A0A8J6A001_GALPY|nr:Paternally-expressed gene 3 protein [Galemys pyrenaicus]
MEKFLKDVSRSPRPGRAREGGVRPPGLPRWPDPDRKGLPPRQREPLARARGCGGHALAGGRFPFQASLVSRRRALERKRRYHADADQQGPRLEQGGFARKRPAACGEARAAARSSSLGAPPPTAQPAEAAAYVCTDCGRCFAVVSEFVEHQIMHTRDGLDEFGESFSRSVAASQARRRRAGGAPGARRGWGAAPVEGTAPAELRKALARERAAEPERRAAERQAPSGPSPNRALGALPRVFGPDEAYECQVCREAFGRGLAPAPDRRDQERAEAFEPSPAPGGRQDVRGPEQATICKACGVAFPRGPLLREHRQARARAEPPEGQGGPCAETFVPSRKRRQPMRSEETLCDFQDSGATFRPGPPDTPSWDGPRGGRGLGQSGPSGPRTDSQRSHTVARPPEDEEPRPASAVGAYPDGAREAPTEEEPGERGHSGLSVIHSLAFVEAQRSPRVGPHPAALPPRSGPAATEPVQPDAEGAGSSARAAEPGSQRQGIRIGEAPPGGAESGSGPAAQPPEGFTGAAGEQKVDGASPAPGPQVQGHQKARAKRKNIEQSGPVASEGHPSRLATGRPRERAHECRLCGESFALSAELAEHQKAHDRTSSRGESRGLSGLRSFAAADPQTSYGRRPMPAADPGPGLQGQAQAASAEQLAPSECRECGACFATPEALRAHQKVYGGEKVHERRLFGDSGHGAGQEGPRQEKPGPEEPEEQDGDDEDDDGDDDGDSIYGCRDCGLGFADRADLRDHRKVHSRVFPGEARGHAPPAPRSPPVSEYQHDHGGEQLYECPACGQSFVHSSFLFEHQKIHEHDPFYGFRRLDEPFLRPLLSPRRARAPRKAPCSGQALQCQECGQDFIHASLLFEHMRAHPGAGLAGCSRPSEGAAGPGLALAELQRSQAEEKQHECQVCGEAFLSRAALREHARTHRRGEPYEYGAAFVHTSFLTEPPRRGAPFFECKDCGASFMHSTVLARHQRLHLEEEEEEEEEVEEAAAGQEARVLVPREALRLQGSSVQQPEAGAAQPNGEAEGPRGEAAEPGGGAEQPRAGDADEPDGAGIIDPEEQAEEPQGDADEPDGAGIIDPEEAGAGEEPQGAGPCSSHGAPRETAAPQPACGPSPKAHPGVTASEPGPVSGAGSRCSARAGGDGVDAGGGSFGCEVCGQCFRDRLSLTRHQDTHTG